MAIEISGWGRDEPSAPRFDEDRLRQRFGAIPSVVGSGDDDFAEFEEDDFDDDFDDDFEEDLEDEYNDLNLDDDDLSEGEFEEGLPPAEVVFDDHESDDLDPDDDEASPGGEDDEDDIPEDEE